MTLDMTVKKTGAMRIAIIALLAVVATGSFADRVIWSKQIVGRINLSNVPVADVSCTDDWLEVAPGDGPDQPMRYRCGVMFWPLFQSGESRIAAGVLSRANRP
jgi:hypothetical protein